MNINSKRIQNISVNEPNLYFKTYYGRKKIKYDQQFNIPNLKCFDDVNISVMKPV